MGKNKKEKPELTLENLNRAIRTYRIRQITRLPEKVSPPDRGGES